MNRLCPTCQSHFCAVDTHSFLAEAWAVEHIHKNELYPSDLQSPHFCAETTPAALACAMIRFL